MRIQIVRVDAQFDWQILISATLSRVNIDAAIIQLKVRTALAKPDAGSVSLSPISTPGCPSLQPLRSEDRQLLSGQG